MKKLTYLCITLSLPMLTSCASIVNGTHQTVSVSTHPIKEAQCALKNDKGNWSVKTPASVVVHRSFKDLEVTCQKQGYAKSEIKVKSKMKAAYLGNVLLGGAIGAGIDTINGAAYAYPEKMSVALQADNIHEDPNRKHG